jgi:hypothetical protein
MICVKLDRFRRTGDRFLDQVIATGFGILDRWRRR